MMERYLRRTLNSNQRGMTLIETLIVFALMGILITVGLQTVVMMVRSNQSMNVTLKRNSLNNSLQLALSQIETCTGNFASGTAVVFPADPPVTSPVTPFDPVDVTDRFLVEGSTAGFYFYRANGGVAVPVGQPIFDFNFRLGNVVPVRQVRLTNINKLSASRYSADLNVSWGQATGIVQQGDSVVEGLVFTVDGARAVQGCVTNQTVECGTVEVRGGNVLYPGQYGTFYAGSDEPMLLTSSQGSSVPLTVTDVATVINQTGRWGAQCNAGWTIAGCQGLGSVTTFFTSAGMAANSCSGPNSEVPPPPPTSGPMLRMTCCRAQ